MVRLHVGGSAHQSRTAVAGYHSCHLFSLCPSSSTPSSPLRSAGRAVGRGCQPGAVLRPLSQRGWEPWPGGGKAGLGVQGYARGAAAAGSSSSWEPALNTPSEVAAPLSVCFSTADRSPQRPGHSHSFIFRGALTACPDGMLPTPSKELAR